MATLWHHRQTVPNPSRRCHSRRRCHRCYVTSWWTVQLRRRYRTISPSKIIIGPLRRRDAAVASTRVQGWGDEPCEPTVRLPDWSELVASYSRMKSASGWANGRQPILVCYIRKYVIILGGIFPLAPPNQNIGGCVPGIPGGVDASERWTRVGYINGLGCIGLGQIGSNILATVVGWVGFRFNAMITTVYIWNIFIRRVKNFKNVENVQ